MITELALGLYALILGGAALGFRYQQPAVIGILVVALLIGGAQLYTEGTEYSPQTACLLNTTTHYDYANVTNPNSTAYMWQLNNTVETHTYGSCGQHAAANNGGWTWIYILTGLVLIGTLYQMLLRGRLPSMG